MLGATLAATWRTPTKAETGPAMLYPHEELIEAAGYPALARFEPGRLELPMVVFVTGGGVLGRIAYGPPERRAADFLCYWLHEEGFASLVLSYPILSTARMFSTPHSRSSRARTGRSRAPRSSPVTWTGMVCNQTSSSSAGAWRRGSRNPFSLRCGKGRRTVRRDGGGVGASPHPARPRPSEASRERPRCCRGRLPGLAAPMPRRPDLAAGHVVLDADGLYAT